MRSSNKLAGFMILMVICGGCAFRTAPPQSPQVANGDTQKIQNNANQNVAEEFSSGVRDSQAAVSKFNKQMTSLADQIEKNSDRKNLENTFLVTSFTNLDKLSETTAFGRLVAENVIHELQIRKWKVYEVRLAKDVVINETGEFSLSRDIKRLKESYKVGGIVTGTYSIAAGHVIVNARVMDMDSGLVVSSAQIHMPVNWFTDTLMFNEEGLKTMRIVGDTPFSCRDNPVCWNGDTPKPTKSEGVLH